MLHWDGHQWHPYHGPSAAHTVITGVTTRDNAATFAVGVSAHGRTSRPIHERWNGHVWTR